MEAEQRGREYSKPSTESRIMSPEEYATITHEVPYVYELNIGGSNLTYFGAEHSYDPEDTMYLRLEECLHAVKPDLVLVEGVHNLESLKKELKTILSGFPEATEKERKKFIIERYGESGYTLFLAEERGIDSFSPEPVYSQEIKHMEDKEFSHNDIFVFYMTRKMRQYLRTPHEQNLEVYLTSEIDYFKKQSNWDSFDYSFETYKKLFAKTFRKELDLTDTETFDALIDPIPWPEKEMRVTNTIAAESSKFRDVSIVDAIQESMKTYKKVFAVFGASHAVMQEPALRSQSHP